MGADLFQHGDQADRVLVAALGLLAVTGDGLFDRRQVGQRQFGADGFNVGDRVDLAGDVDDIVVVEAAHHVDDGIGLADVGQELVAEAFTLAGAGHQTGDVDEFDDGRLNPLRLDDLRQFVEARIGHFDDADVRFDGAERVVRRFDAGLGQRVEQRGLADVGQADNAAFEAHGVSFVTRGGQAGDAHGRIGLPAGVRQRRDCNTPGGAYRLRVSSRPCVCACATRRRTAPLQ